MSTNGQPHEIVLNALPARKAGRVEVVAICRRMALEEGDTLESMVWRVVRGLADWGARGDAQCARLFLTLVAKEEKPEPAKALAGRDAELVGDSKFVESPGYVADVARVLRELDGGAAIDKLLE